MKFYKMHSIENDFVIIFNNDLKKKTIEKISDRKSGVGCDQLLICDTESYKLKIYNNDGNPAGMCLNGIRCLAYLFFYEEAKNDIVFSVGQRKVKTKYLDDKSVQLIIDVPQVVTGKYDISGLNIPNLEIKEVVDIGNNHLILFFSKDISKDILTYSAYINELGIFKDGINISFCYIMDRYFIKAYVYERGSGFTRACGSAAASIFYVAYKSRLVFNDVTVIQEGGDLKMSLCNQNKSIKQIGEANYIFKGDLLIDE